MAFITNNQLTMPGGMSPPSALEGAESPASSGISIGAAPPYAQPPDGDTAAARYPIALPISFPSEGNYDPIATGEGGFTSGSAGGWNFSGIMSQIGNVLGGIFNELGNFLASLGGGSTPSSQGETSYSSATANSVGDPHLSFEGTTGAGAGVTDRWNDMGSHADLLDSDSFAGGYRVSTTATAPAANGITYNASATVTTAGGDTSVTVNANGSYAVTEDGRGITLQAGQTAQLGGGETVTLDPNGALTVSDRDSQGGTLSTTLTARGHGVDVDDSAQNVDLGGYLVTKSDANPVGGSGATPPPWYAYGQPTAGYGGGPVMMQPMSPASDAAAFDPEAQGTSLRSIESL